MSKFSQHIFITRKITPVARELLSNHFHVEEFAGENVITKKELIEAVKNCDGLLTTYVDLIDEEVLRAGKRLKAVSNCAVGLDNIDVASARKMGIAVYNTPDIVTNSTADLTLGILLAMIRRIPEASAYVRAGRWKQFEPMLFLGEELQGKTFGIFGYGRIGKAVARRAAGFGLKIVVYHRSQVTFEPEMGRCIEQVGLEEFYKRVDYLSLHVPLTAETRNLIDLSSMKKMVRKPILINLARGAIVNTDDLYKALTTGILRGAALDVTDPEPLPAQHPLLHLDNCLVLPHLGTGTEECRYEVAKKAAESLVHHFSAAAR
ncbi:MAG: D-glycerate dehydrogenase [Chlamydiales bacterium]|nr:D-glycerate dehydrogenase [Chlamydiales bacterium]